MTATKDMYHATTIKLGQPDTAANLTEFFKNYVRDTQAQGADLDYYRGNAFHAFDEAAQGAVEVKCQMMSLICAAVAAYNPDPSAINLVMEDVTLAGLKDKSTGTAFTVRSGHQDLARFSLIASDGASGQLVLNVGISLSPVACKAAGLDKS
jgi:hypothetical protein